jgi:hypothetical protein
MATDNASAVVTYNKRIQPIIHKIKKDRYGDICRIEVCDTLNTCLIVFQTPFIPIEKYRKSDEFERCQHCLTKCICTRTHWSS